MNIVFNISKCNILRRRNQAVITISITAIAVFITLLITSVMFQVREGIELSKDRVGADIMLISAASDFEDTSLLYSGKPIRKYIKREAIDFLQDFKGQIKNQTEQFFTHTLTEGCCSVNEKLRVVGIDSDTDFLIRPWLEQNNLKVLENNQAIVGSDVIYPLGDRMLLLGQPFDVVGTLYRTGTGMDRTIFMPIQMARDLARTKFPSTVFWGYDPDELISSVFIKLEDGIDSQGFAELINQSQYNVVAAAKADTLEKIENTISGWIKVVLFLTGAVIVVSFISLFGRFTALLKERKKEIGYLRSLGFSAGKIFSISMMEVWMMSITGGLIASLALICSLNSIMDFISKQFVLPRSSITGGFIVYMILSGPILAMILGFISSVVPGVKSANLEPKDAMTRGEV